MNNNRTALIDADVLKYLAGFAVQKTIWTHKDSGEWFEGKKAANAWWKEYSPEEFNVEEWDSVIELEPFSNCAFILDNKVGEILHQNDCTKALLCMTPHRVFRHDVAVTKPYKGNRVSNKPQYETEIIAYLKDNYDCMEGDNIEADDLMGMLQTTSTVIATNDKDMQMIAGEHYNFTNGEKSIQDILGADRWFLIQLIAGDSTDNIQGIPKWGMVKATELVDSFEGDHWGLVEEIKALYVDNYEILGLETLDEMAALVWILRAGETPETAGWRKLLYE